MAYRGTAQMTVPQTRNEESPGPGEWRFGFNDNHDLIWQCRTSWDHGSWDTGTVE
ncbi:20646_t:CDS:2 [Cetraspora pellucida]|uniref:20646_t:CDS:1 n=1 Tax=Cetraspora pellucida TaxID=1433469 RepID=A0A9N9FK12_9GLOM|nr:20646_t:CDS:2 [Cetraspora pellucida]